MARVLVTGATGCLGHEIALQLLAEGDQVVALGRNAQIGAGLAAAGAQFVVGDLTQGPPPLQGIDVVHHCAALSSAWGTEAAFRATNVTATTQLLHAARAAGVGRFVFTSSPSIYADGTDRFDLAEDAPLPAIFASLYAASKAEAEAQVLAANSAAMPCVALRPRGIYGRGDRSLLPRLLAAMRRGRVPMIDGGQAQIDLTHVSDAARAQILAGRADGIGGRVFNVTSGVAYTFTELVDVAARLMGLNPRRIALPYGVAMGVAGVLEGFHHLFLPQVEPILTRQAVASLGKSLTLDISAARAVLGYVPRVELTEGMRDYVA